MAKAPTYHVAENRALSTRQVIDGKPRRIIITNKPGMKAIETVVPAAVVDKLGDDEMKRLIRTGFVVRKGYEADVEAEDTLMVDHNGSLAEAPPTPPKASGLWNVDPKKLKGKKLDGLNVMIAEKDGAHAPAATIAEAIAVLSADFAE